MSSKVSPRSRRHKHKEDSKHETIVQVHKIIKSETSSEKDNLSNSKTDNSEDGESNMAFRMEDHNENYNTHHTPSREISVDGETQINSKILSLIETEMKRDINKHSHFTDSRPQSLSFYEDEKIPEELSGNLELLSPEERRHYKRRKDHNLMDQDERNAYNVIQDLYNGRENEEIMGSGKKSKSRKKRHTESEVGIGDSREMMIPKEKKKSKKKKRESSPMTSNSKRKHKKRDEEAEPKSDIVVALEELQDDVFENHVEDHNKSKKMKELPDQSDKLYVQRKNKFESTTRPAINDKSFNLGKKPAMNAMPPLRVALWIQYIFRLFFLPCHGLLAGLAFGQWLYIHANSHDQTQEFLEYYSNFSDIFVRIFYALAVLCLISSFDRVDVHHLKPHHFKNLFTHKQSSIAVIFYSICLILHLSTSNLENKLGNLTYDNETISEISPANVKQWNHLSFWRSFFAVISWITVSVTAQDDMLYLHLASMEKYLASNN